MNKKMLLGVMVVLAVFWLSPVLSPVYANISFSGGESQITSFFDGTTGFLVKTLGTGIFILGLIIAGIKITAGDQNGLKSSVMVMIGGALIFLAKPLVGIIQGLAGTR